MYNNHNQMVKKKSFDRWMVGVVVTMTVVVEMEEDGWFRILCISVCGEKKF